jgi:hypothetical protein
MNVIHVFINRIFSARSSEFGYDLEAVGIRVKDLYFILPRNGTESIHRFCHPEKLQKLYKQYAFDQKYLI